MPYSAAEQIILQFAKGPQKSRAALENIQKQVVKAHEIDYISNDRLLAAYRRLVKKSVIAPDVEIENFLRLKKVRSLSGIVVVSVLTKPYPCPGNCLFCPTVFNLPKSYVESEPAVLRAQQNNFDPYRQTLNRLEALNATGHLISKINLRTIGGTWSYYPKAYQTWFIKRCFQACNDFGSGRISQKSQTLEQAQKINEKAKCRLVEVSIETRQDFINPAEILRLRKLGVTKVELGVQSLDDDVLKINRRGHDVAATIRATKMLKDAGFKISYQMMLNLPGSTPKRDFEMMKRLFDDPAFQPDFLKIYPLALLKTADVYEMYKKGKFRPYSKKILIDLIGKIKAIIPPYVRIERVIRDISSTQIIAGGAKVSNLRQIVLEKMKAQGLSCQCIRCREVRGDILIPSIHNEREISAECVGGGVREPRREGFAKPAPNCLIPSTFQLVRRDYVASDGQEIFLTIEDSSGKTLYSLLRLRIPSAEPPLSVLKNAAIIRDLHTYGALVDIGAASEDATQHKGFGKLLLAEAERIAKAEFGKKQIAIISGVGAREYFKKLGYKLKETYMVKSP
jgi:elongator complex protein 3